LNPRGETTTGLAIQRLAGLGHPRAGAATRAGDLKLESGSPFDVVALGAARSARNGKMRVVRAGVLGAGAMGAAIAEVLAYNEIPVVLRDVRPELLEAGMARVRSAVQKLVEFHAERGEREIQRIEGLGVTLSEEQRAAVRRRLAP
jgi:NADPH-dependent 2,4-dienoyl-CoA reductase/sulfur reductase-like enzyme